MVFIVLLSLFGMAFAIHVATRRPIALCLFAVAPGVPAALYLAALGGYLHPAAVVLFYGGFAAGVAAVAWAVAGGRGMHLAREALSPGIVLFVVSAAAYWAVYRTLFFHMWDEFSHWGIAAREMAMVSHLPYADSLILFQDYPPGTALSCYFCTMAAPYSEPLAYFAHFILVVAPLTLLVSGVPWRRAGWIALTVATALLLLSTGGAMFTTTYVDCLLSIYAAMALYCRFTMPKPETSLFFIVPSLFFLPLIKKAGSFFAVVCLVIILVDTVLGWLATRERLASRLGTAAVRLWRALKSADVLVPASVGVLAFAALLALRFYIAAAAYVVFLCAGFAFLSRARALAALKQVAWARLAVALAACALAISSPFVAHNTWQSWVKSHRLVTTFEAKYTVSDAIHAAFSPSDALTKEARTAFLQQCRLTRLSVYGTTASSRLYSLFAQTGRGPRPRMATVGWAIFTALVFGCAVWLAQTRAMRIRLAAGLGLALVSLGAYLVGLFSLYMYAFKPDEGPDLVQFSRYVWSYVCMLVLLGWGILAFAARGRQEGRRGLARALPFALCLAFAAWMYLFENQPLDIIPPSRWATPFRGRVLAEPHVEAVLSRTSPQDSVFVVLQDVSREVLCSMRYDIMPRHTEFMRCLTCSDGTITFDYAPEGFKSVLKERGFTRVYVAPVDERFYEEFADLFDDTRAPADHVFRVENGEDKDLVLVPVRP